MLSVMLSVMLFVMLSVIWAFCLAARHFPATLPEQSFDPGTTGAIIRRGEISFHHPCPRADTDNKLMGMF